MAVHEHKIRVRYAETDAMGVVHHSVHYIWFEIGRLEFCRARGLDYRELENEGIGLVVVEANCKYRAPAHFDEELILKTSLESVDHNKAFFSYEIERDGKVLAVGKTAHISVNFDGEVTDIPPKYLDLLRESLD